VDIVVKIPRPYPKQSEIIKDDSRFKVICAGRRVGKSTLCKIITLTTLLKGKRITYITPEYGLADKFYNDISVLLPSQVIKQQNKSRLELKLITGGELKFFSGEALQRSRGWECDLLIVDEAAYISDLKTEWDLSLRALLMTTQGSAIFISTPKGKNFFYSLFQKGINNEDGFKSWQFSSHLNPYIPKKELDELLRTLPTNAYSQEVMAEPGENISNPFGTDNIQKAIRQSLSSKPSIVYAVDVAAINDYTVITGQDEDGCLSYFDRWKLPWEQTHQRIKALRDIDPYTMIVIDSTGVGQNSLERLQAQIYNVIGFQFTAKSKPIVINDLIKDMETGAITINEMIAQEMATYEFKYTSGGNLTYNAASGYHDDTIASLAMCNYYRKKLVIRDYSIHTF
jgi:hypothetical protein